MCLEEMEAAAASSVVRATTIFTVKKKTTLLLNKLSFSSSCFLHHPTKSAPPTNNTTKLLFSKSSNVPNEPNDDNKFSSAFTSPDDLSYLWKLGAGSVIGAVVIKYGSVLFPAITTPNLIQALLMISIPMLLAVLLLIRQSSVSVEEK